MLIIRSLIFNTLMYVVMLVYGVLFLPLAFWSRDATYWALNFYVRTVFWMMKHIVGIVPEVRGKVPEGEVLIGAKHQSFLDILILFHALPRAKFIMKKELKWAFPLGTYAMRIGSTPVDRGKRAVAMKGMVEGVESDTERGQLVIYPQGTRVAPGAEKPYKIGAGVLYDRMGVVCVPAATNAGLFWGRNTIARNPGTAIVEFLEPIDPGLSIQDFIKTLEERVEPASDALMAEAGFRAE